MNNNRILYWDIAKAIAIFFVVWGHCLQNMTMDKDYWLVDRLSQFIIFCIFFTNKTIWGCN